MPKAMSRQKTAQLYFALGHQRRLRIIDTLKSRIGGLTFEELEFLARIPRSSLSHHVRFLKDAGLLHRQVKNRFTIYSLNTKLLDQMTGSDPSQSDRAAAA